jgi:hypothetical protein
MEQATSTWITSCLEMFGEFRDAMTETIFLSTYGSPLLQAVVGLGVQQVTPHRGERDLVREAHEARLRAELEGRFEMGRPQDAALRALVYIRLADGSIDERGFAVLKQVRASRPAARRISLARFKEILREQYLLVRLDEECALGALPKLLSDDDAVRKATLDLLHRILAARGDLSDEEKRRLTRVEALFGALPAMAVRAETAHA